MTRLEIPRNVEIAMAWAEICKSHPNEVLGVKMLKACALARCKPSELSQVIAPPIDKEE